MGFCGQSGDKWIYLICHIQPEIRRYCRFYYHYYYYSAALQGLGDLSSPFRDWSSAPAVEFQPLDRQGIPVTFRKFLKTLKTIRVVSMLERPLWKSVNSWDTDGRPETWNQLSAPYWNTFPKAVWGLSFPPGPLCSGPSSSQSWQSTKGVREFLKILCPGVHPGPIKFFSVCVGIGHQHF